MKKWKVKFKKLMDKEWNYCEKPFSSLDSANFFVISIKLASTDYEAQVEEESNGSI